MLYYSMFLALTHYYADLDGPNPMEEETYFQACFAEQT